MREIDLIVIHCSATRVDRDVTAQDINAAHKVRGFSSWGYHFYIRKNGKVEPMRPLDEAGAHARGYNARSIGICYEGGLDVNGRAADTRTLPQRIAMHALVSRLLTEHPEAEVLGHRDLSPDKNYNGIVDPWERTKECPCFEVRDELWS
ncbi:N-acetylmuramoyl-L-alanine amidase [Bacteroides sedimenti]|uniref:N-acetylmuramoyl-L-alanine amidase n=1 Tax=Bacteroides sedimenti TaxID=2136147 RepID=A0ABM8I6Y5_9BACE